MLCVAYCDAEHAIICSEKDVNHRPLGAGEMEGIVGPKPHRLDFLRTCDSGIRERDRAVCPAEHTPDTRPTLATWRVVDFFLHNGTTEPLPFPCLAASQDQEDRLGFQPDAILALIIKRAVQATEVKIDAWHRCRLYH